jgi:RNA 2',3'-cyclic 3'-phosphodiesterase
VATAVRLFIAIQLTDEVREALRSFLSELPELAPKAKWVRSENLHLTLKFLGHTDPAKLADIENALAAVRSPEPVSLDFRGLGFFPNERRPRVFWVGMQAPANLATLAEAIDRETHELGFPLETRPFTPHLTLARFEPPGMPPQLNASAKQNATRTFGSLTTQQFQLIESKLKPAGAEYTTLKSFPFVAGT